mgnify:CR=1 FL=1|tara:strand:- start:74 stop:1063 length:990 start_codon:yes stop_codon:yes gene_type:complete
MANTNEEIDLMFIYNKIREKYDGFLLSFYRWIRFLIKFWIVVLLVIGAGILLGYFMENNAIKSKETTVIAQINFDGVHYVYDGIEQLKKKINEGDKRALEEIKENYNDIFVIQNIEIEPLPNILDIINITDPNNGNIKTFLDQSKYEDDLLMSEMFLSEYKTHKITITTTDEGTNGSIEGVIKYLNNNRIYNEIQKKTAENIKLEISETQLSISLIDSILRANGTLSNAVNPSQLYLNTSSNVNLHFLVQEKDALIKKLQEAEAEQIKIQDGIVSVLNKPMFKWKGSLLDRKMIIMPILFFIFFSLTVFVFNFFRKMKIKDQADRQNSL